MTGLIIVIILVVVVIALAGFVVSTYNKLVNLRNRVENAWAQIDVQLKRRADLIPNIVETVKGYASHERGTLEDVINARNAVVAAPTPEAAMEANNQLTGALRQLFALSESYPELKANTNFLELQAQLTDTEDKISYMRQSYNDVVMMFNTAIETFPTNFIAGIFNFTRKDLFVVEDAATREAPKVSFE